NTKGRKVSLAVYVDDEANDLSDLGIGTSTASGKSSLSEDFDNNSVLSDNPDNDKPNFDIDNQGNDNGTREYVSSPGYDTSSTHPPSSPDLCEYTYEGAIQDYKSRVSRAQKSGFYSDNYLKDTNHESNGQTPRKQTSIEIENRLSNFIAKVSNDVEKNDIQKNLPKVDIARRRELFEKEKVSIEKSDTEKVINNLACDFAQTLSIKERLLNLESRHDPPESSVAKVDHLASEFGSVKDRLLNIENASINQKIQVEKPAPINVPIISLKDRLSTLQETAPLNADTDTPTVVTESISNEEHIVNNVEESEETNIPEEEQPIAEEVSPTPDVAEQPNRLLSTINEAIHLVEDQPENMVKRDASVSSPNLFENHVLDDIVVDNEVLDDTRNTNPKSYLVMDSISDEIVHTSRTDDITGNAVLTSDGESLCISSHATFSDCNKEQSNNNELHKVEVIDLHCPIDKSNTLNKIEDLSDSNIEQVKVVELEPSAIENGESKPNDELRVNEEHDASPSNADTQSICSVGYSKSYSLEVLQPDEITSTELYTQSPLSPMTPSPILYSPSFTKESSESKNNRIKCQIVGVLEKHKCTSVTNSPNRSDLTLNTNQAIDGLPSPAVSPALSPSKSPFKSTKNIFDFIKRNLLNDPLPVAKDDDVNSTFYVPLIKGDGMETGPSDSCYEDSVDESNEINILIDEELEKLEIQR
ncbi:hypothetical protein Bhyg_15715, partial [Pseudolycoriella hygida]